MEQRNLLSPTKPDYFKFQKQERIEDFGLNIDFFKYRPSDSQIGRFWMVDPLSSQYPHNSVYALQENKFGLGVELEGKELSEFFKGFNNALREDIVPFSQSANRAFESNDYSLGKSAGHIGAAIFGVAEIIVGGTGDAGAAVGTVGSAGLATPVTAPLAIGATALIGHGVSVVGNAVNNLSSNAGTRFSPKEKSKVIDSNKANNDGKTVCENCGTETVKAKKSEKGVTPLKSETQVDHITPKSKGGQGKAENGQVLCRDCNRQKSDKQ